MLSAVKISELLLHPQANDPNFIDQDHILPVLGKDGSGVWTTYQAPISSVVPNIEFTAQATSIASTDSPTVGVTSGAFRNQFDLDFHIPKGTVPTLSGRSVITLPPGSVAGDARVVFDRPFPVDPNVDFYVDFHLPPGPKGDQGDQGIGINFKGFKNTKADLDALITIVPSPCLGDAWFVKEDESIMSPASSDVFYIWSLSGSPAITTWVAGGSGLKGPKGETGAPGIPTTFSVSAISLATGEPATVAIIPDPAFPSFPNLYKKITFGLPQGLSGVSPVLSADPVAVSGPFGTAPSVLTLGTTERPVFKFTIPQGPTGLQGLSGITPIISVGSVSALSAGATPIVRPSSSSTPGNQILDFGIPMGRTPTVLVGAVSALAAGATPIVRTTTSTDNLSSTLSFGIPVGRAATISITNPTLATAFGNPPLVTNTGNTSAASFQFTIPAGQPGDWTTPQTIKDVTGGTSYTLIASDVGKILTMSHGGGTVITVPTGLMSPGAKVDIIRMTSGAVSFVAGAGAVVNFTPSGALRAQYSSASVICTTANNYVVVGDLA